MKAPSVEERHPAVRGRVALALDAFDLMHQACVFDPRTNELLEDAAAFAVAEDCIDALADATTPRKSGGVR